LLHSNKHSIEKSPALVPEINVIMNHFCLYIFAFLFAATCVAQEPELVRPETLPQGFVLIVKDNSGSANQENPIYLASSINGWNPSDEEMMLSGRSDTRWQIVVDRNLHGVGMQFKFTLGGWDREELDESGNSIENRSLGLVDVSKLKPGERPVIEFEIPQFRVPRSLAEQVREQGIYRKLQVTGDVRRIEVRGGSGGAEASTRDLLVWVPEGYDAPENKSRTYPVIYMFDGQNLFEQPSGVPAEWSIDETLTSLIEQNKIEPMIVVGIPHSGEHRIQEFMPFGAYKGINGDGKDCMQWVIDECMTKVNRAFRVRSGSNSTAIGGASLGGAMALYGATQYPELFGKALIESLPMLSQKDALGVIQSSDSGIKRYFVGMGTHEAGTDSANDEINQQYVDWAKELDRSLARHSGSSTGDHLLSIGQGHVHNESAWSARFGEAIQFLFPKN
jgi:predicted alpha/beta superfamily hydrolase